MRQTRQSIRDKTAKFLILFRPASGDCVRSLWMPARTLSCIPGSKRNWKRFSSGVRPLLNTCLKNAAGRAGIATLPLTKWCTEHGVRLLYTPNAGSWLNMAESVQRIIVRRALEGHHIYDVEILKDWLRDAIARWNRHPTPFI